MTADPPDPEFAEDVREGLGTRPRSLPPKWLYDERGSKLFEEITELDVYYLTDVERAIFRDHADEIVAACPARSSLVELGAGSADKTRLLVEALVDRQGSARYWPIDISPKALEMAEDRFREDPHVEVHPVEAEFVEGLAKVPYDEEARLVAFIGSSIGNLPMPDQKELLASVRQEMGPDDRFLLGTDLAKDPEILLPAYDDPEGVTAAFTLNLLRRMNRELGADFDLDRFRHRAVFDEERSAVRIYFESLADQTVHVEALDATFTFEEGEHVHTEDSYKYTEEMLDELFDAAGMAPVATFHDEKGWFAEHVLEPV